MRAKGGLRDVGISEGTRFVHTVTIDCITQKMSLHLLAYMVFVNIQLG